MKTKNILFILGILIISGALPLGAASYNIKQMTPEIKQAFEGRRGRYHTLRSLKTQGAVGENNQGYISVLAGGGQAGAIAASENKDREVIYRAIVDQNGLGSGGMAIVQKIFAEERRGRAHPGESIQQPSGSWTKK